MKTFLRFLLAFIAAGLAVFFAADFFCFNDVNIEFRSNHFDSPSQIVSNLKGKNQADILSDIFSKVFTSYTNKISSLYFNMTICIILCVLAIIVVRRRKDIELPGFSTIRIPIQISYLVIPATLCYYWIQFGVLLHDIIGLRLELVKIIQANYMTNFAISDISQIRFSDYFSYTPINSLKDSGFIDAWFLFFQPASFPVSQINFATKILPQCTMVLVGLLYGIAQGFAIGLPYNWIYRYKDSSFLWKVLCIILLTVIGFLIFTSHFTFYFGVKNYNWLQFPMLISTTVSFLIITSANARDHYKLKAQNKQSNTRIIFRNR